MKKKKKILVAILSTVLTLLIVGFLIWFLYENKQVFQELKNLNINYLVIIFLLSLITLYFQGLILKLLASPFNIKLKEHFMLFTASGFLNLVTPFKGGAGLRAIYMKKRYNLNYSNFIASFFGNYILIFLVSSVFSLITILLLYVYYQIFNIYITCTFSLILISTIFVILLKKKFKKENFITEKLNKIIDGWRILRKDKKNLFFISSLIGTNIIIAAFINQITFLGLGLKIPFIATLFLSIIRILSIFLNITPGAIGITEFLYLFSANILNISPELSVLAALIIRAVRFSLLFTLGPIFNIYLVRKLKKSDIHPENIPIVP